MLNIQAFKAVLPNTKLVTSPDSFFTQVKEQYATLRKAGYFEQTEVNALYIYAIATPHRTHFGILAALDVEDYIQNRVLKHEQTITTKEDRSLKLLAERGAMIKPVLVAHKHNDELQAFIQDFIKENKAVYSISFRGQQHSLWQVAAPEAIAELQNIYNKHQYLYIADGHHRMAAAQRLYEKDPTQRYILTAFFSESELKIWDYNRVVEGIGKNTPLSFMARLSEICTIQPVAKPTKPTKKHEFAFCIGGEWFLAAWRNTVLEACTSTKEHLDADLLNEKVLKNLLGIDDIRTDFRVSYWEGVKGLDVLDVRTRTPSVGFALFPVEIADLMQIAEENGTMPPKSTWFEPRIKNGFIAMKM